MLDYVQYWQYNETLSDSATFHATISKVNLRFHYTVDIPHRSRQQGYTSTFEAADQIIQEHLAQFKTQQTLPLNMTYSL